LFTPDDTLGIVMLGTNEILFGSANDPRTADDPQIELQIILGLT